MEDLKYGECAKHRGNNLVNCVECKMEITMNIQPINFSDFNLVVISDGTPHCVNHGAMNKMNRLEDGGGYWRCLSLVTTVNDNKCRAGCQEIRIQNG